MIFKTVYLSLECKKTSCTRRHPVAVRYLFRCEGYAYFLAGPYRLKVSVDRGELTLALLDTGDAAWCDVLTCWPDDWFQAIAFILGQHSPVELTQEEYRQLTQQSLKEASLFGCPDSFD